MRTLTTIVSAMLVTSLISVVPVLSAEKALQKELLTPKKDTCLLFAKSCQDNAYVLQLRVDRLQGEISKGTAVYTNEELKILRQKLDDTNRALDFVFSEGA